MAILAKSSVLFVCLGNICRSTMAEIVFLDVITKRGIRNNWFAQNMRFTKKYSWFCSLGPWILLPPRGTRLAHLQTAEQSRYRTFQEKGGKYDYLYFCQVCKQKLGPSIYTAHIARQITKNDFKGARFSRISLK
jgi:hypothetical protein